jgi:branched-chain amino acid transport system permease protein
VRSWLFLIVWAVVGALLFALLRLLQYEYLFFAGYVVLQFVVLATAWNILGGYCGYVNFGSAAFFALGAYSTVTLHKIAQQLDRLLPETLASLLKLIMPLPIPALVLIGGIVAGLVGLGTGYLTLRLRGAFFAIATLALAVVLQTLILNWSFVGGARGAYVIPPNTFPVLGTYIQYLFLIMLALAVVALTVARAIERSRLGYGFATIRDDELAAEASGVPTLRLKLIATTLSGAFMGMAGAPFPYYIGYLEPSSAFGLAYAVNSIAMPMIGGTGTWIGPLVGALLLGTIQQVTTVTISSAVNLLIVGLLLVNCVILAPNGLVGLVRERRIDSALVEPAVFALLYALNAAPMYFLVGQGKGPQIIGLVFWAILTFVAYERGRHIGRIWLIAFPIVGALLSLLPITPGAPVVATILGWSQGLIWLSLDALTVILLISTILQVTAMICGLLPARQIQAQSSDQDASPASVSTRSG